MRVAALAIGLLPLLVVEAGLRIWGPAADEAIDYDALVDLQQVRPLFERNPSNGRWEIPPWRMNFFRPASFAATKSPQTRRVFVLGGSTVQGRPYSTETAFSSWLQLRLQAGNPELHFEVINCGGVSYASYRVAKILDEVLQHQPDAIVLYSGHNEYLEDRTYEHLRSTALPIRWISNVAGRLRTVRWLRRQLRSESARPTQMPAEVNTRLDQSDGLARFVRDDQWRVGVEQHFANSLERMIVSTEQAGVPLLVCLPASELVDTPPFKTSPDPTLEGSQLQQFQDLWQQVINLDLDPTARLAACQQLLLLDPRHAGARYVAGRLNLDRERVSAASEHLIAARDHDVCPLRATTPILEATIRSVEKHQLPWIDVRQLLDQTDIRGWNQPDGLPDPERFVDHVHPTIGSHQRLAQRIAEVLRAEGIFKIEIGSEEQSRYEQMAEAHLNALDEAYYARGKQRLAGLKQWAAGRAGKIGIAPQQ